MFSSCYLDFIAMCPQMLSSSALDAPLNLAQVTIHTFWEGLHQKKHDSKPFSTAMWFPEYPVPIALTKLTNKQNLFQTPIARNSPWITGSSSYLPWSRLLRSGMPGSQLDFPPAHPLAPSPQSLTLSWHWSADPLNMIQSFSALALLTFDPE